MPTRRQLFRWSMTSAAALTAGALSIQWLQEEDWQRLEQSELQYSFLTQNDQLLLTIIAPAILGQGYLNEWRKHKTVSDLLIAIDKAIGFLSQATQKELRQLFDLLWNRLGKLLLAGLWTSWSQASVETVSNFIEHWRNSWLTPLNQGYLGLQQLFMAALFSQEEAWPLCQYPGPPF